MGLFQRCFVQSCSKVSRGITASLRGLRHCVPRETFINVKALYNRGKRNRLSHCIVLCNQLCFSLISSPKPYLGWEFEGKSTCEGWWEQAAWLRWVPVHHPAAGCVQRCVQTPPGAALPLSWAKFSCGDGDGFSALSSSGVWLFWAAPDAGTF